ncbi:hypothetical protein HMPREF3191_00149 [Veillonellaceae bacterium DNF00626]|nr:hypothetical protein HMPREF3191_00149 [Veillonellaceae bacterium DNF00626]
MRASEFPVLFNFSFFESLWKKVEYDTIKRNGREQSDCRRY